MSLDPFFNPSTVAVVGASRRPSSVGHAVLKNLLPGPRKVHAVNPKGGEILGVQAHPTLSDIEGPVDLMVVAIPPRFIPELMREAGERGVGAAIVISAGFSEMGEDGKQLQAEMTRIAADAGIRIVGPNCLGIIRPPSGLNASFAATTPPKGPIGLVSQSGALITGLLSYAEQERFGLSAAVSLGAKADVSDVEILQWLADDEETRAIALYVEALTEPRAFVEAASAITPHKPIVALKGGTTEAGAKAASSHTGSLAGAQAAYRAAFAQAGIIPAETIGDLLGFARALAHQPKAKGNRVAIVTNAGGPGVLSADEAVREGLSLAQLSEQTRERLDQVLPSVWSRNNPVDIIGDATPERYRDALNVVGSAPEVDGIVVIMTVQAMTDPTATAEAIAAAHEDPSWHKPLVSSFLGLAGTEVGSLLDQRGVPELSLPEQAVRAMGSLMRETASADPSPPAGSHGHPDADPARAAELVDGAAAGQVPLDRARQILAAAGIRYNRSATAASAEDAARLAPEVGWPMVVKVVSPDVVHKSDVGGVVLGVADEGELQEACRRISEDVTRAVEGARIEGFTLEEQVSGTEIIVGMSHDPVFGPLMMVGLGGIFVEVFGDVSFRLAPLTHRDALQMISELACRKLLDGARGRPVLDRHELAEILVRVSNLVEATPAIAELDVNPLVITADGLVAIDARVVVRGTSDRDA